MVQGKKIRIRKAWKINPKTRVKKSKKLYSRKRKAKEVQDEIEAWAAKG